MSRDSEFMCGVVEGFYGQPWSQAERFELFDWMRDWNLNTYLYAPKDDLKHRAIWRELYSAEEGNALAQIVERCDQRGVRFIYALAPGLDMRYSEHAEFELLCRRFDQMMRLGCCHFALLFDDIPERLSAEDKSKFGSFAAAHAQVTNAVFRWVRTRNPNARFLFCPTPYCGRMAGRQLGGPGYLETAGRELAPEIDILWTGPEIIPRTIEPKDLPLDALQRPPVIWDNLHANDYDRSRCFCGPYSGRESIREHVRGILSNPNNEFPVNYVPLRTLASPAASYESALREWRQRFETAGQPITFEQLRAFTDCFYLPHEEGETAKRIYAAVRTGDPSFKKEAAVLREFCQRAAELKDRKLFYALAQRIWDLREELDLLERSTEAGGRPFKSDFHLPKTYRGGFVRRLQRFVQQQPDGSFIVRTPHIRCVRPEDQAGTYYVCLKTGDFGRDGEPFYRDDPEALGRIFVGPYIAFQPEFGLVLEDGEGVCGYAFGALDSREFYARYEAEWRPNLCAQYPMPAGDPESWTRAQMVHSWYHQPDYFCPEPYDQYPSHLHIDLLERAQGRGFGRRMLEEVMRRLAQRGSPGAHLGVSARNAAAFAFYQHLGFEELVRTGSGDSEVIYMGKALRW